MVILIMLTALSGNVMWSSELHVFIKINDLSQNKDTICFVKAQVARHRYQKGYARNDRSNRSEDM